MGLGRVPSLRPVERPQAGRRYVFFLTRYREDRTLHILTGYELSGGMATPLDGH